MATCKTDKYDVDVYLPVDVSGADNIDLNEALDSVGLKYMDLIGVGGNWDLTAVMGGGVALEAVYFLYGKDAGKSEIFKTKRQDVGLNGGAGVYGISGDFFDDKNLNIGDYTGTSFSGGRDWGSRKF